MTELVIDAVGITKRYGDVVALDACDLSVPVGAIATLLANMAGSAERETSGTRTSSAVLGVALAGAVIVAGPGAGSSGFTVARGPVSSP